MIAMALALEPAVLIADEPTTALDVTTQVQILKLLRELQERYRLAVMFITHDFGVVSEIADEIAVMRHGELVEHGAAGQVLAGPAHPYTRQLLAAVPSLEPPLRAPVKTAIVLQTRALAKTYRSRDRMFGRRREVTALHNVDLAIRRGEVLGLVGESGSGKTTLGRVIVRLLQADSGSITIDGAEVSELSRRQYRPYRKRVQMIFQDPFSSLNPRRTVGQIVAEGLLAHGMPAAQAHARARELLHLVKLSEQAAERYPHGGATMFALLGALGNFGGIFMPWLVGMIADNWGLRWGLASATFCPLIMLLILEWMRKLPVTIKLPPSVSSGSTSEATPQPELLD